MRKIKGKDVHFFLDEDAYVELKLYVVRHKTTVKDFISGLIKKELQKEKKDCN